MTSLIETRTALIVGAGIGGLAAGVALQRAGWRVRIHERAAHPRELGFGVLLAPNALAQLRELGVATAIAERTVPQAGIEIRALSGRVLRRLNIGAAGQAVVALRPDLHGVLLDAVGADALQLSSDVVSFAEHGRRVVVTLADGQTDVGDILIGADGVRSVICRGLCGDEATLRPSGYVALRGVAYGATAHLGDLTAVNYLDHALEAATARAGRDGVYWYISLRARDVHATDPREILRGLLPRFEAPLRAIAEATAPEDLRFDPLMWRPPLARWGEGNVTLLGDAAHPVLPHTGQGAAQALEDAVALGLMLKDQPDIDFGLRIYEVVRQVRTMKIIRLGPRLARMTTTANPLIKMARSLAIRWMPDAAFERPLRALARDPHDVIRDIDPFVQVGS